MRYLIVASVISGWICHSPLAFAQTQGQISEYRQKVMKNEIAPKAMTVEVSDKANRLLWKFRVTTKLPSKVQLKDGRWADIEISEPAKTQNLLIEYVAQIVADIFFQGPKTKNAILKEISDINSLLDRASAGTENSTNYLNVQTRAMNAQLRLDIILVGLHLKNKLTVPLSSAEVTKAIQANPTIDSETREIMRALAQLESKMDSRAKKVADRTVEKIVKKLNEELNNRAPAKPGRSPRDI